MEPWNACAVVTVWGMVCGKEAIMFIENKCTCCGDCLYLCQYTDYSRDDAVRQIKDLITGEQALILDECITCMACNEMCPQGAYPFELILAMQEKFGIKTVDDDVEMMIEKTLSQVPDEVTDGEPDKPAVCVCVMEQAYPKDMLAGGLFKGMSVIRGGSYFSRIVYMHMGNETIIRQNAQQYVDSLAELKKNEIVFVHDDCYVMVSKKAPEYGIEVSFKARSIMDYIVGLLMEHRDTIQSVNKRVAFQRPCIERYMPENGAKADMVFDLVGAERVKREYDRQNALCCGIGLYKTQPERARNIIKRNLDDARQNRAEAMLFACPSCYSFLKKPCEDAGILPVFITDLCRLALGESPADLQNW